MIALSRHIGYIILMMFLTSCGQKGPLYLPESRPQAPQPLEQHL